MTRHRQLSVFRWEQQKLRYLYRYIPWFKYCISFSFMRIPNLKKSHKNVENNVSCNTKLFYIIPTWCHSCLTFFDVHHCPNFIFSNGTTPWILYVCTLIEIIIMQVGIRYTYLIRYYLIQVWAKSHVLELLEILWNLIPMNP